MKNSNTSFPLKIAIGMEQIGSGNQKYTRLHPLELNGFVAPMYGPGFCQDDSGSKLGFPWAQGHFHASLDVTPTNLPSAQAWWAKRSVFHWYDHLAAIFVPSVVLESVISHTETLTRVTQKALDDSNKAISLLNSEVFMTRKAVLQNCMVL